jgi:O-acetyl-ADP-ribose deacetylase (regulator of RNase III)
MEELGVIRNRDGGCPTGSAVVTGEGELPAKYVFHAVGPVYHGGGRGEPEQLAGCYRTCMKLAVDKGARTISFPAISTGAFGYPEEEAAQIAVREVGAFLETSPPIDQVIFVVFSSRAEKIYRAVLGAR